MSADIRTRVREAFSRALTEKGADYVYPGSCKGPADPLSPKASCQYASHDGTPSCIIGHVFADLDPEFFRNLARVEADSGSMEVGDTLVGGLVPQTAISDAICADAELVDAMELAQRVQDFGAPWRLAVAAFDDALDGGGAVVASYWLALIEKMYERGEIQR